jgi:hypothetical protein
MASPTQDIAFDSAPHLVPGLEGDAPSLDRRDATLDLVIPCSPGIRVDGPIQACEQFGCEFCASIVIEPKSIRQDRCHRLRHRLILRPGSPANKRLQPTAAGGIMSRRG